MGWQEREMHGHAKEVGAAERKGPADHDWWLEVISWVLTEARVGMVRTSLLEYQESARWSPKTSVLSQQRQPHLQIRAG